MSFGNPGLAQNTGFPQNGGFNGGINSFGQTSNFGTFPNQFGGYPVGGFGSQGSPSSGNFNDLLFSLNNSPTFGPSLLNNSTPLGTNPQAINQAAFGASQMTTSFLDSFLSQRHGVSRNQFESPLNLNNNLQQFLSALASTAIGVTGALNTGSGTSSLILQSIGPAINGLGSAIGAFQAIGQAMKLEEAQAQLSQEELEFVAESG
jgi:hypothetical protein